MNDPLADVNPELRKWLTPEMVDAVTAVHRTDFSPRIAFWHMPGGDTVLVGGTTAETGVEYGRVVVDPSLPWPPQPVYEFGDKVTFEGRRATIIDPQADSDGELYIAAEPNGTEWACPSDLSPGWPD